MFASLQHRRKFDEATSATDDVTPVYLLEEIWQSVHGNGPEVSHAFVEAAQRRLSNKSPVVKQKTLRVVKYVCSKGSSDFKRHIAKHATAIRELTHYKGEPDPFKGDALNQKVRETAKEALDAVFSATDNSYTAATSSSSQLQGRIQGFGSSVNDAGGLSSGPVSSSGISSSSYAPGFSSSGSSRYQGFGNPRFESRPSSTASTARETASAWVSSGISQVKDLVGSKRPGILRDEENAGYSSDEGGMGGSSYRVPGPAPGPTLSLAAPAASSTADSSEEERLVDSICSRGGLRAQPDREALRLFVESLANLSGPKVAQQLQHKIESGSWQEMLRALCALEAVLQQGSSASCGECAVHFQTDSSCLQAACKSPQVSVRQRALKVFQLVGGEAASSSAPSANGHQPPVADLLGPDPDEPPAAQTSASAAASGPDLLGDLLDPVADSQADASSASGMGGLFSGLDMSGGQTAASASGSASAASGGQQSQVQNPPGDNLLAGLMMGPSAANGPTSSTSQQQAATPDLFGGLSMAGNSAAASTAPAASRAAPMLDDLFAGPMPTANGGALASLSPTASLPPSHPSQQPADPLAGLGLPSGSSTPSQGHTSMSDFGLPGFGAASSSQGASAPNGGLGPHANMFSMGRDPLFPSGGSQGMIPQGMGGLGMPGQALGGQGMSSGASPSAQPTGMQWPYGMMGMPGQQPPPQLPGAHMRPGQPPNIVYMPGMQAAMYGGPIPGGLPPAQFAYIQRMMGANFPSQAPQLHQPAASFGFGQQQQQQQPPQRAGSSNSSGAISADVFAQPTSSSRTVSDLMGREIVSKKDTFDFVTDHLDTLKIAK